MKLNELLATPCSNQAQFRAVRDFSILFENEKSYPLYQNIPVLLEDAIQEDGENFYEQFYQNESEPWSYSGRAAEILRHEYVVEQVKIIYEQVGKKLVILDLGCSLGHITEHLHPYGSLIVGLDISPTAVAKAKKRCAEMVGEQPNPYEFVAASTLALPFKIETFDVVIASDGVMGWFEEGQKDNSQKAVAEIYRVLKKGGIAIHTDYMHPRYFDSFVRATMCMPFEKIKEEPLYDRLWYRTESWLKIFRKQSWAKRLLANVSFAKKLRSIAKILGRNYSKHISVIAKK